MSQAMRVFSEDQIAEGFGAFDEIEFLGSGSFGETYRIRRDDDQLVLKVLRAPGATDYLWEREIEALTRIEHPNVVGFRGSGIMKIGEATHAYLTCDYVSGGDLATLVSGGERPDPAKIRELLSGLLAGVGEIHDLGVLHRDIKPANVALDDGDWGQPVLLDFGLARVLDMSTHTNYPAMMGTPAYMAPEQLRLKPARRRSDLFSVGVVVYEAGTGVHPFRTTDVVTLQRLHDRIKAGPPPAPRTVRTDFPPDVEEVVLRLVSYWAHERLGISEAMNDLEPRSA